MNVVWHQKDESAVPVFIFVVKDCRVENEVSGFFESKLIYSTWISIYGNEEEI